MRNITIAATGHRPQRLGNCIEVNHPTRIKIRKYLLQKLQNYIQLGYKHFVQGMAKGFDRDFAHAVIELRFTHNITLEAALPYVHKHPDAEYKRILGKCDIVTVVNDIPEYYTPNAKAAYIMRDHYMVDKAGILIALFDGVHSGGTYQTVKYAEKQYYKTSQPIIDFLPFEMLCKDIQ